MNNVESLSLFLFLEQLIWNYVGSQKKRIRDDKEDDQSDPVVISHSGRGIKCVLDASQQLQ